MSIHRVEINNFKSLSNLKIDIQSLNCLIGENGVGKTNILNALKYYYENMLEVNISNRNFDNKNIYNDKLVISITYDLSRIERIVRSNHDITSIFNQKIHKYILDNLVNNNITLRMVQNKSGSIEWNYPYEVRSLIQYIHPFYFIDSRDINLTDWNELWKIIGDIGDASGLDNRDIDYSDFLTDDKKKKFSRSITELSQEFKDSNIQISKSGGKSKVISLYQMQLGGREFNYNDENLSYFSDGTNSGNYIKLMSFLVSQVQKLKLKDPIMIIDEPEIGLHPKLTDELMEKVISISKKVQFLMATHSPRIVKNLIIESGNIYRLHLKDNYTRLHKMYALEDNKMKNIVSEKEASFYFARGILFVEGPTELELFNNKYLKRLFPILSDIEIVSLNSNDVILEIINPSKRKLEIPYIILVDSDKILGFNNGDSFYFKSLSYSPFRNNEIEKKEKLYYKEKRLKLTNIKDEIEVIIKNNEFRFDNLLHINSNDSFYYLMKKIKEYSLEYSLYPVHTTIEGSLVNNKSADLFIDWYQGKSNDSEEFFEDLIRNFSEYEVSTVLRILVRGKHDDLSKFDEEKMYEQIESEEITQVFDKVLKKIGNLRIGKTSGWVTDFINFVFSREDEKLTRNKFKDIFPEIYDIIYNVEKFMSK